MTPKLNILILEDVATDAELMQRELRKGGVEFIARRVDTREDFVRELEGFNPDIILADYSLPAFDGLSALRLARERRPDTPVIIVTGALGDETAVLLLREGAAEYVLKSNLPHLPSVLLRVLNEADTNKAYRTTHQALRESEQLHRCIFEQARDVIFTIRVDGLFSSVSPAAEAIIGWKPVDLVGRPFTDNIHPDDLPRAWDLLKKTVAGESTPIFDLRVLKRDGGYLDMEFSLTPLRRGGTTELLGMGRDVTERNKMEERRHRDANRHLNQRNALIEYSMHKFKTDDGLMDRVRQLTEMNARTMGVARVGIWRYTDDHAAIRCVDLYEMEADRHSAGMEVSAAAYPNYFQALAGSGAVDAHDANLDPRTRELSESYLRPLGISSMLDVPIRMGSTGAGVLCHEHTGPPRQWTADEIAFAAAVASLVSLAFETSEREKSDRSLLRSNRALKALSACNVAMIRIEDEAALLQEMCDLIVNLGGYPFAWIGFAERDEAKGVRPMAHAGLETNFLKEIRISWADDELGRGPTGLAIRTGQTQIARDLRAHPAYSPWRKQALARGYVSMIALPLHVKDGETFGSISIYASEFDTFDGDETRLLTELADDLAFAILALRANQAHDHLQEESLRAAIRHKQSLVDAIGAIARTVEQRDPYTAGHQNRVAGLCVAIAAEMGFDAERIEGLRLGALIHDIGKISVPAEILNRPGKISPAEFEIIKEHAQVGYDIIKDVQFPWPVANMILQHHERLDGTGYPQGLKGEAIILEAHILAVADVVEAITAHRPYRPALGIEVGLDEIRTNRGTRYDPVVVDACLRVIEKGYRF